MNDVTWLFPPPKNKAELEKSISMDTLKAANGEPLWTDTAFQSLLTIADSQAATVAPNGPTIKLPANVRDRAAWRIAAIRVDPSAPGISDSIIAKFGSSPQIRLILQPVTVEGDAIKVKDIAVHVIYSYVAGFEGGDRETFPKFVPDKAKFQNIVNDLVQLKALAAAEPDAKSTDGLPLGVHPGFESPEKAAKLLNGVRGFLTKNLPEGSLRAMAIMGIPSPAPEPWIFVAIVADEKGGFRPAPGFNVPVPTNTAQMLSFVPPRRGVFPPPVTDNLSPITDTIFVSPGEKRGVSTAVLFEQGVKLGDKATISMSSDGVSITDAKVTNGDIPDIIANPETSHFFNTDCISCHTETTRRAILHITSGSFAFQPPTGTPSPLVSETVRPTNQWNVRNIGWGPNSEPTITQRAANETAEVAAFINANYLSAQPQSADAPK